MTADNMAEETLTPYQRTLLKKIRAIEANPIRVVPNASERSAEQVRSSRNARAGRCRSLPSMLPRPFFRTGRRVGPARPKTDSLWRCLQIEASTAIHKRVNPGYVETPYRSTNTEMFNYVPPPDFSRMFLKKESDCGFQKYAAEAILKHVDLKKTSH